MAKSVDKAIQEHLGALVMQAVVLNAQIEELVEKVKELEAKLEAKQGEQVDEPKVKAVK